MKRIPCLAGIAFFLLALAASAPAETARGTVFEDRNGNNMRDAEEPGIAGVPLFSGEEVILTGPDGSYEIPVEPGDFLFLCKPAGYDPPVDENRLPRFFHLHDPEGTPSSLGLRYPGTRPTGPLPERVDFPLLPAARRDTFTAVWFSDTQPQSGAEIDYIRDDVVEELIGSDAAFGITTGDILFDDLSLAPRLNAVIGRIGIPWYNVPGNHESNYLSPDDERSLETFKRIYGPPYYSFDYGSVHFVVLDDVIYEGRNDGNPRGQGGYAGGIDDRQLRWLANDLRLVPRDRSVVLAMHIPLMNPRVPEAKEGKVENLDRLLDLLEGRRVLALAGHTHTVYHAYLGPDDGFRGPEPLHHHVIATVCGSWWSGPLDERGIPSALQRDGTPNGYYLMEVEGASVAMRYRAAGSPPERQMRVVFDKGYHGGDSGIERDYRFGELLDGSFRKEGLASGRILVNLFDGGPRSAVEFSFDGGPFAPMRPVREIDPYAAALFAAHAGTVKSWVKATECTHLWAAPMPVDLAAGAHVLAVRATDEYGGTHRTHKVVEVSAP